MRRILPLLALFLFTGWYVSADAPKKINVLFVGDNGHHKPADRHRQLAPVLAKDGIDLVYTGTLDVLTPEKLAKYDAVLVYANHDTIKPEQADALLEFVEKGKALVCLHCGSFCFRNAPKYVEMVGAQFKSHGTGVMTVKNVQPDHPIMKGYKSFESFDETYVHAKHNEKDRTVLELRDKEPWTWVRTQGKGKVFYTAWGHDDRTWGQPGFQNLVSRGILWATGNEPKDVSAPAVAEREPVMTKLRKDVQPFEYVPAKVAFYPAEKGAKKEPLGKMQKPLPVAESMKHFVHPDDFELKLFIDESKLPGKPLCMNWDEQGRLWVSCTTDYPNNLQPPGTGSDKIVCCEDTDGDGAADKVTVFADKLSIPTSIAFHKGGLIVHSAPDTLFLKDNDGDGKADERRVLFTGWGTRDTHAGPSNLRYGHDNYFYGIVGYSGFSGAVGKESFKFSQGFYRFKPETLEFEFLRSTNNNSWGVGLSEEGLLFGSTANGNPSVFMPLANRYYEKVRGSSSAVLPAIAGNAPMHPITDNVRQVDWHHHFTAAAGHALYTARVYPPAYWNKTAFVTEPTGHLVATFKIDKAGTDHTSRNAWNLLASDDEWSSPIMAEVGPDGNVWVIDWYNFIIQHNPTPVGFTNGRGNAYETPLRDKTHGRIYRLVAKNAKVEPFTLKDADTAKLVATLRNPNMFWRLHAQRLLIEKQDQAAVPMLVKMLGEPKPDAVGIDAGSMHALWTLSGLHAVQADAKNAAITALKSPAPGVRRAAVQALGRTEADAEAIVKANLLADSDEQVRLAALLALSETPSSPQAGSALVRFLDNPANAADRVMRDGMAAAAANNAEPFVVALLYRVSKETVPAANDAVLAIVAEHLGRSPLGGGQALDLLGRVETTGGANRLLQVYLGGVSKGLGRGKQADLTARQVDNLRKLFAKVDATTRVRLLSVARAVGVDAFDGELAGLSKTALETAANEKAKEDERIEAVRQLLDLFGSDNAAMEKLLALVTPRVSPALATTIVEGVVERSDASADAVAKLLPQWSPIARAAAIKAMLSRKTPALALLQAIERKEVPLSELSLDQKQATANHMDRDINRLAKSLLAKGDAMPSADRQKVIDEFKEVVAKAGDAKLGKEMYKKHCGACHKHGGEGGNVGPDLTGMAVHPKEELLVHILDPSRSVEGNFRMYTIRTTGGKSLSGLLASESKTAVEIVDAQAKKETVQREDIEEMTVSTKSLMPEGFEKQMTKPEFADLMEFLTSKGKYVPLPLDKAATITSVKGMFFDDSGPSERLTFPDWKPKTFNGVPFSLVDPEGGKRNNVVLLFGPNGIKAPTMPRTAVVPCNTAAKAIHVLGGISGWGFPNGRKGSVSMIVRLHYKDGLTEDHPLKNGEEMADYIREVDVPNSKLAFKVPSQQVRYLALSPKKTDIIEKIELVKGPDATAPIVVAITVETP